MFVFGNIFGGLSSLFLGLSVHQKDKKGMVCYQVADCVFAIISCLFLKGFSGAASNSIALIRNILELKKKNNKLTVILIAITIFIYGILNYNFIEHVWYSWIPIVASMEYTLGMFIFKRYKYSKICLLINELLWFIYSLFILNYIAAVTLIILVINTIISLIMSQRKIADNGLTKFQKDMIKYEIENEKITNNIVI